ncbi:hypothetical protein Btru_065747 [Bulinus truncatus]|nr:hypothetical protein Btru_065747 [Bulinus truncatus]
MFYEGQYFASIQKFIQAYRQNEVKKAKMNFPSPKRGQSSQPSTLNIRGKTFPQTSQAGPREYGPDGRRYRVKKSTYRIYGVEFVYRISTVSGPQAYGLMPGVDCPEHATFLPQYVFDVELNKSVMKHNAFCVFEHNTGVPLRRHNSNEDTSGRNYGGLVDRVLVVRSIIVEFNYDYIFDVIFHHNGAIEVKSYATGYVMSQVYHEAEKPFGFQNHRQHCRVNSPPSVQL